jgi:drug/metabolite transporter (DMT)-like permease
MNKGIQFALLTALISGFSIFFSKIFVSKMDPIVYTTLKNILVALALSLIVFRPKFKAEFKKLTRGDWIKLVVIGIVGGSIPFALFFTGLTMTSASTGAIIQKTLFIWVALFAIVFLREKLRFSQMLAYVLILWGAFWVTGFNGISWNRGELMILASAILWGIEYVIAKKTLTSVSPELVAWSRMALGSVILLGIVVFSGKTNSLFSLTLPNIQAAVIGAAFLTGYVFTWYKALSLAPATVVSVVLTLSTIITGLLSTQFLTTKLTLPDITGYALIAIGVFLVSYLWYKRTNEFAWSSYLFPLRFPAQLTALLRTRKTK